MDRVLSYAGSLYPMTHSTPAEIVSHADISSDQPSFLFVRFLPRRAGLSSIEPSLFPSVCATIHVYNVAERNGSILSNYLFRAKEKNSTNGKRLIDFLYNFHNGSAVLSFLLLFFQNAISSSIFFTIRCRIKNEQFSNKLLKLPRITNWMKRFIIGSTSSHLHRTNKATLRSGYSLGCK